MRYVVYKSLDKPSSLFGLKGSYLYYCIGGLVVAIIIAAIVWSLTNGLIGTVTFILGMVADYIIVLRVQSKFTERERTKYFCSHKLPRFIIVEPKRMSKLMMANFHTSGRYNKNK